MKKILLATTILSMSVGFAAAEVKVGGSAKAGIARASTGAVAADTSLDALADQSTANSDKDAKLVLLDSAHNAYNTTPDATNAALIVAAKAAYDTAKAKSDAADKVVSGAAATTGDFAAYSSVKITFAGSGVTDGGLEFGASTDTTIGAKYDSLGDFDDESKISTGNTGSWGIPTVYLSGSFGKISFSANNLDFFDDANGNGDVQYGYTAGDVTVGLVADIESSNYSASLSANVGGVALSVDADTYDIWNASAAYTSGPATITLSANEADVQKIKVAYSADGMSASAKFGTDDSWEITGGYTAGALSLALLADSGDYQEVTISSDLGGGAKIVGGANSDQDAFAGVELSF